ncbi:histone deacetylase family protein [Sphingobium boeckii]|uniref:Acetoin utilization deacetylase AcuC-like enzyme n=1 Tax=Sphingobium boeckii TaxID=1082345 RepID=A0A7W9ED80_9SPHN|nr:histone deacetylase family protein [Sphingobium boeckii]MBB5684679.1 acetoin utilization deacetylase AcuC-like enzyme [Sphingobium boeckii]
MKLFFDPRQLDHAPALELHNGGYVPYAEHPGRVKNMLARLTETEAPTDRGETPIARIHGPAYLAFLKSAHRQWVDAGRAGDATGYVWPIVGRRPLHLQRIDAQFGQYSFDAASPVAAQTWDGAYWAAQTALAATDAVLNGAPAAFALCRPPGHHAGADYLGGYCYLNNVAIAAQAAIDAGKARVAILDVDYHHGNGTQDIFYDRGDVLFVSIHADPVTDYPFFWGHADECGDGAGEGANLNIPLPRGTGMADYQVALKTALYSIAAFAPEVLLVSFGADTYEGDPISQFKLKTEDFTEIAAQISAADLPTVIVMEGGYATEALGDNVASFLSGF